MIASLKKGGYSLTFMILHPLCFRQHMKKILHISNGRRNISPAKQGKVKGKRLEGPRWRRKLVLPTSGLTWTGDQNSSRWIVPETYQMTSRPKIWRWPLSRCRGEKVKFSGDASLVPAPCTRVQAPCSNPRRKLPLIQVELSWMKHLFIEYMYEEH